MATGTKETAGRLRTEAGHRRDCDGGDTLFDRRHCGFAEHVYGLPDKPAGLIDPQSS